MGDVTTKSQAWAVEVEDTEGTYKAPTAAGSYVQALREGSELTKSKETVARNIFTGTLGQVAPRVGMFTAGGSLATEWRGAATQGEAPEIDRLIKAALGAKRSMATEDAVLVGSTASVIKVASATKYKFGDIILIKVPGAHHVSPIIAVDAVDNEIELLVPLAVAPAADVAIAKFTTYHVAESGHDSLSVTRYYEKAVRQYITGAKVSSMALGGFSVSAVPSLTFGLSGLNFDSDVHAQAHTPSYSSQLPPIILGACVFMDGQRIDVNELTLNLENAIGFKTSTCAPNGRAAARVTERTFTGTINPYAANDSVAVFTKFKANTPFSLFALASLPGAVAGEKESVIALYLPNCVTTELADTDAEGLVQEAISFSANRGSAGMVDECFMTFI